MSTPVIDIEKTSLKLKELRTARNIKISELQTVFCMENPQSIYNWENPEKKNLPRIDNLVILAEKYKVRLDDMIVIKKQQDECIAERENTGRYGIPDSIIEFVKHNSSSDLLSALSIFYKIDFSLS